MRKKSAEIKYLINLHKEGKIDDNALNKALNTLRPASDVQKEPSDAAFEEKVKERRRRKKKLEGSDKKKPRFIKLKNLKK